MEHNYKPDLTKAETKLCKEVQSLIAYCSYCQPYDGGDVFWLWGVKTELNELLMECEVPEESMENIISHLYCPNCNNESFYLGSDVGLKTEYEKEVDAHVSKGEKLYGKEVKKFVKFIEKAPLLAYKHKFAKKIFKEIKDKKFPTTSVKGEFFRVREVTTGKIFSLEDMINPPLGKSNEGRFNHAGQSHLYLSNDRNTAIKEVVSEEVSSLVWIQKFSINPQIDNLLDLSFDWNDLTPSTSSLLLSLHVKDSLGKSGRNNENWKPDYYITRFIMDCAKSLGYSGIKYNSTKKYSEYNLVIFENDITKVTPIDKPIIEPYSNQRPGNRVGGELLDF